MPRKQLLFDLVQSLSRSEKRYFKLFCAQSGAAANYLRLFDAMEKQEAYDEQALKKKFAGETFIRQLHVTKHYLRNLILKSLRNFHAHISKDAELKDILRNVEILFHKELYPCCQDELQKARTLAENYELYSSLVDIDTWQRKVDQAIKPNDYEVFLHSMSRQQRSIEMLNNTNRYWQFTIRSSQNTLSRSSVLDEDDLLLDDITNAKTLEARVLHYNTLYFKHLRSNNVVEAERTLHQLVVYLEGHPERIDEEPGLFASSVNNFLSFLVFRKKYEQALKIVQRAKIVYEQWKIVSEKKTLFKQIMRTYNIELEIYRDTQLFEEKLPFIAQIEAFVTQNRYKMPRAYLVSFWFQLANIFFMLKDYEKALSWLNEILNMRERDIRLDLQIHARILNLMVHLDQQNLFVLRYFVDSTRRFFKKHSTMNAEEKTLLKFFSTIARTPVLEYRQKFAELRDALYPQNESPNPVETQDYIDYRRWIEGNIVY